MGRRYSRSASSVRTFTASGLTAAAPAIMKGTKSLLLLFLLTLFAGGGAFYYFKYIKPKDTAKGSPDFSDFEFDEDEESGYEDDTDLDGYGDGTEDAEDGADDTETDGETELEDDTEGGL